MRVRAGGSGVEGSTADEEEEEGREADGIEGEPGAGESENEEEEEVDEEGWTGVTGSPPPATCDPSTNGLPLALALPLMPVPTGDKRPLLPLDRPASPVPINSSLSSAMYHPCSLSAATPVAAVSTSPPNMHTAWGKGHSPRVKGSPGAWA